MEPIITRALPIVAVENVAQGERNRSIYLQLVRPEGAPEGSEEPILLGTGRNAVVFLATDTPVLDEKADYRAMKFLRDDPDDQLAYSSAVRFFQEARSLAKRGGNIDSLVRFLGWGAIARDLSRRGPVNSVKEFWWRHYFDEARSVRFEANNGPDYERIKERYGLQGPFYCLQLCHGTLEHLLERNDAWSRLPSYRYNQIDAQTLHEHAGEMRDDIATFVERYLQRPDGSTLSLADLADLSGYDILNAFRSAPVAIHDRSGRPLRDLQGPIAHDPNLIRDHVILKLFLRVVQAIQNLHRVGEAHRDLKPGNIFFWHSNDVSLASIDVKLADLGYVTNTDVIKDGETFKAGSEQAPGSPFYRAPEQADLPIEVRITADPARSDLVTGKGSKISNIRPSDWLFVADLFEEQEGFHIAPSHEEDTEQRRQRAQAALERRNEYRDQRYYRIVKATVVERAGAFTLQLDRELTGRSMPDLQAQVSKSTGFHTDVYSLGALLYDLASGGRNPEHFYTYCLKVFTDQFGVSSELIPGHIEEVLDILAPEDLGRPRELRDRFRLARLVLTSRNIDGLIEEILRASYVSGTELDARRRIRDYRFRTFDVVNTLLTDKRGVPIPREIVRIIVRCMLRDIGGAFCSSDASDGAIGESQRLIVKEIEDAVNRLLGGSFRLPEQHFPDPLQENLLFRLRALGSLLAPAPPAEALGANERAPARTPTAPERAPAPTPAAPEPTPAVASAAPMLSGLDGLDNGRTELYE